VNEEAAGHLADLNAAYEVHLVALRARVDSARAAIEAESFSGSPAAPYAMTQNAYAPAQNEYTPAQNEYAPAQNTYAPAQNAYAPPNPYAEHALIPDTPLVANDDSPLWHDD
jgi:hypothetical protein